MVHQFELSTLPGVWVTSWLLSAVDPSYSYATLWVWPRTLMDCRSRRSLTAITSDSRQPPLSNL